MALPAKFARRTPNPSFAYLNPPYVGAFARVGCTKLRLHHLPPLTFRYAEASENRVVLGPAPITASMEGAWVSSAT